MTVRNIAREFASNSKQSSHPSGPQIAVVEEATMDNGWNVPKSGKKDQKNHNRTLANGTSSEVERKQEALVRARDSGPNLMTRNHEI